MSALNLVEAFRDSRLADGLKAAIRDEVEAGRHYRIMEFCGGHTHAIFRHGVQRLMPDNVHFIHGPGCPVCVLPGARIDAAIHLAERHGVILCSYGDLLRVPGASGRSLQQARAAGADIRMLYSPAEALTIARENPRREVVFFAIGFETTTPPSAVVLRQAAAESLDNFSVFCNHVLTPAAMRAILDSENTIDAILGPSHVSVIIGTRPYLPIVEQYHKPLVVTGFEPLDVMQASLMAIRQINQGRAEVENEYTRVVDESGNTRAQALVDEVFALRDEFEWRGLGWLKNSALGIREKYSRFDAEQRFELPAFKSSEPNSCECPSILRGQKRPDECRLFGGACTPETPLGACMVSSEGACAAYWSYARD